MINEYSRTELLIGSENMEKLKKASVAVFGVGGVGSHCIEALARCGIGRLILIDNDDVSLTNINRQSIAYHSTIGRMKCEERENQRHRSEYQSGNIRDFCSAGQCKRTSGTDRNYSLYNRCDRYGQCENCPCGTCRGTEYSDYKQHGYRK